MHTYTYYQSTNVVMITHAVGQHSCYATVHPVPKCKCINSLEAIDGLIKKQGIYIYIYIYTYLYIYIERDIYI